MISEINVPKAALGGMAIFLFYAQATINMKNTTLAETSKTPAAAQTLTPPVPAKYQLSAFAGDWYANLPDTKYGGGVEKFKITVNPISTGSTVATVTYDFVYDIPKSHCTYSYELSNRNLVGDSLKLEGGKLGPDFPGMARCENTASSQPRDSDAFTLSLPSNDSASASGLIENVSHEARKVTFKKGVDLAIIPSISGRWEGTFTSVNDRNEFPKKYFLKLNLRKEGDLYQGATHHQLFRYLTPTGSARYRLEINMRPEGTFVMKETDMLNNSVNSDNPAVMYLEVSADGKTMKGQWAEAMNPDLMQGVIELKLQ